MGDQGRIAGRGSAADKARPFALGYWLLVFAILLLAAPLAAQPQDTESERGPLRLAMSGAFQPFSTTDEDGNLTGFDHDIAVAIAERMGYRPVPVQTEWGGIFQGLQEGKYELICGSVEITEERSQRMDFSLPYYVSGTQVFARRGIESLEGLRIGVTEATTYEEHIISNPDQFPDAEVIRYGSEAEIIAAINTNKIDAFVSDLIVGQWYATERNADVEPYGPLLYRARIGICARRDSPELVAEVNAALIEIVADGTYSRIYRKWVGAAPDLEVLLASWHEIEQDRRQREGIEVVEADSKPEFAVTLRQWVDLFIKGAVITLKLGLLTAILAMIVGTLIGVLSVSKNVILQKLAQGYVMIVRGTPLLVQLFIAYYAVATALNRLGQDYFGVEIMGAFGAALLALVVNTGAYNAETIRGGILSVEKGQWEAAASLGMTRRNVLRRVILPQAFRNSVASLGNNIVVMIKDTSLVGVITLIEITFTARNIVFQTGDPFMPFVVAAVFYLVIITLLDQIVKLWEKYMMRSAGAKGASA